MSIIQAELKQYKAAVNDDTSANGGLMSASEITHNVKNNVFPDVSQEDRTAGVTQYRKVFHKVENDNDLTLSTALVRMTEQAEGDDRVTIFSGTQSDTQADISSPDEFGIAALKNDVSGGATSLVVTLEDSSQVIFYSTAGKNMVWIGNGTVEEFHDGVTISKSGDEVTITLAGGDSLTNSFLASNTVVASVLEVGDILCSEDNWVDASAVYDESTYPLTHDNIGCIEETWTITISADGTSFTCSGATVGAVDSGNVSTDFSPINSDFNKPYFTLDKDGWSGQGEGDVIQFQTHPASAAVWRKRIVPAGAAAVSSEDYVIKTKGQTA